MYRIQFTGKMKKDVKRMKKRGKDLSKLQNVLSELASGRSLPDSARDHQLIGHYHGFRECHIEPDWLLIYRLDDVVLTLIATETGSHADLFGF